MTVRPSSFFILASVGKKFSSGTEPLDKQPPLTKQPKPPFLFRFCAASKSPDGVFVGAIVFNTFLPQCPQSRAQASPVTENVGKRLSEELKCGVL
jgi:hypothetical protein